MRTRQDGKTTAALLDMPEEKPRARRNTGDVRRGANESLPTRRERPGMSGDPYADDETREYLRSRGRGKRIRRGLIPQSRNGRIAAGVGMLAFLAGVAALSWTAVRFLHHDAQFTIPSSAAIELRNNQHLSRSQLLSVFGEDVDRNIFDVPLKERQEQLEQMPWVEHATVMRLLPNRLRVDVVERTPIAFVRQGGTIGMADASGVLLDIPPDAPGNPNYSFPVVTGLKADDTPESREQRMRLYSAFLKDMDSGGKKISAELSEVDLSDPEDVKALLPSNNAETLVHFGTGNFLARYNRFQEHVAEWRQQYPRLSSVDMRYDRQVVLQMPPKDSAVSNGAEAKAESKVDGSTKPADAHGATAPTAPKQIAAIRPVEVAPAPTRPAADAARLVAHAEHLEVRPTARRPAKVAETHGAKERHGEAAKKAEMAKKVEAIKQWMARRQQTRDAAKAHAAQ